MTFVRYFRSSSAPNVLVTFKDISVDRLKENFNVIQYNGESTTVPHDLLLKYLPLSDGIFCQVCV